MNLNNSPVAFSAQQSIPLNTVQRSLTMLAMNMDNIRTATQVCSMIQDLHIAIQLLSTVAYKLQSKTIKAAHYDIDPTETGLRII